MNLKIRKLYIFIGRFYPKLEKHLLITKNGLFFHYFGRQVAVHNFSFIDEMERFCNPNG